MNRYPIFVPSSFLSSFFLLSLVTLPYFSFLKLSSSYFRQENLLSSLSMNLWERTMKLLSTSIHSLMWCNNNKTPENNLKDTFGDMEKWTRRNSCMFPRRNTSKWEEVRRKELWGWEKWENRKRNERGIELEGIRERESEWEKRIEKIREREE